MRPPPLPWLLFASRLYRAADGLTLYAAAKLCVPPPLTPRPLTPTSRRRLLTLKAKALGHRRKAVQAPLTTPFPCVDYPVSCSCKCRSTCVLPASSSIFAAPFLNAEENLAVLPSLHH